MTMSQACSTSWAHCPTMMLTNPTRSDAVPSKMVEGVVMVTVHLQVQGGETPICFFIFPSGCKLRTVKKNLLFREWSELRNKVFLHSGPFFMQGHSSGTNYTSNHKILNLLILQMEMSPLIVNPKEKRGCVLTVLHPCHAAVLVLWDVRRCVGQQWQFGLFLSYQTWKIISFSCLFQHGTPPLLIAAGCGNIQMLQLLIKRGSRIDVQDKVIILFNLK